MNNIRFIKDVGIVIKTVKTVIRKDGISSTTSQTMKVFRGTQNE